MYVILTYDVVAKRNPKVLKTCRQYLTHVQKSVFEGYISEKQLNTLKDALIKMIDFESDQIAIYRCTTGNTIMKEIVGYHITMDNII